MTGGVSSEWAGLLRTPDGSRGVVKTGLNHNNCLTLLVLRIYSGVSDDGISTIVCVVRYQRTGTCDN
jgi:hypothetical protein